MKRKIKILIADDQPLFLKWLNHTLSSYEDIELVGKAKDGKAALQLINETNPDVALIDYDMPGLNGIEVAQMIKEKKNHAHIIILSVHTDPEIIKKALSEGVEKYMQKESTEKEIINEIYKIYNRTIEDEEMNHCC